MAEKGVKVLGMWASPMVIRVEWALRLKGVRYEYVDEDLANKSDALLRYNPVTKKVPVLVHDGKPVAESAIIVEYIDETWKDGYPIMPADPYQRAQARFWARFADEKCNAALYPVFTATGEAQGKVVHEAQQCLKTLEKTLEGKKFFGGDAVGYLDVIVGWYAYWLPVIEEVSGASVVTDEELPLIKAWFDRFLAVDVVKEALPPRDKLLALNKRPAVTNSSQRRSTTARASISNKRTLQRHGSINKLLHTCTPCSIQVVFGFWNIFI